VQSKDIIRVLENPEAISFMNSHISDDVALLSLKYQGKTAFDMTVCLQLMAIYKKAKKKLPSFWRFKLALDARSYEQSSSEAVAEYKASFIKGDTFLDITGGLGVDSISLSKGFCKAVAVEQNEELHTIAAYNASKMRVPIIRVLGDGVTHLSKGKVTWLYIDPDRRSGDKRTVDLKYLSPNVIDLLPLIHSQAEQTYIKLSPLYDIREAYRQFSDLRAIYLIAERGEMKEVGLVLSNLKDTECQVHLVDVASGFCSELSWSALDGKVTASQYSKQKYIHIPNALVSKASAAHCFVGIEVVRHIEFELFFSDCVLSAGFRNFELLYHGSMSAKSLRKILQNIGIKSINILIKGSNEPVDLWHKKLGTSDGGDFYAILCKGKKKEVFIAKLIS
jgi:peptidyl-tRNA hydrolase